MGKTLVIAEKPSVARDLALRPARILQELEGQDLSGGRRLRHHVGRRAPRRAGRAGRVRPEAEEVALRRPADHPGRVQARPQRRSGQEAAPRDPPPDGRRRGRADRQRLRRRPRGRADLRLPVRDRAGEEAGPAALALLDDQGRDLRGVRGPAPGRGDEAARGGGPLALRGGLARRHERHPRRLDPAARGVRRRRVARPRPDAHARARRAPRGGDPRLQARALLARRGEVRRERRAPLRRPLPGRQAAAERGRGQGDRRGLHGQARPDHEAREEGGGRAAAAPLRPDLAPAPRQHAARLLGAAHALRRPAPLRGAQGAHLPAHELALPDRRHDPRDQADRGARRAQRRLPARPPST